jgi:hypothetical protein
VVDVGKVRKFLVGLYGEGLLSESMPDLTTRHFYVGRDLRAVVPLKHELSGYHARFFAWFSPGPSGIDIDFPPRIHFTKPGNNQASRYHLELERVGGVDGAIQWIAEKGLALQVSLSYTKVRKGQIGRVYSGDVHALYLLMVEFEDKRGGNNHEPVKKVVNEVVDRVATFVEEPFIVFSGNKSFYLVFTLPTLVKVGGAVVRDRFGRVVRGYSLNEVYRALFNLVLKDKAYLGLSSEVITRFVDAQVAEPKRLLRIPGFKHEKSGREAIQLDVDLRLTDFSPDALAKSMLPNSVLTDYWAYIDLPKPEKTSSSGVTTYTTQNSDNKTRGCLPAWVRVLINYLIETGELCHYGRLAIASWMIRCGFTDEEIHKVFRHAHDYNPRTTQYHINYTREKYLGEKGGRPVRCETVVENCKGHNVPSINCKSLPNPPTKPEAPTADPKPKEKPESKTETKSEVKPADAKPRQVSTPRVGIELPDTVIEGVAKELRETPVVVREVVNWVVGYLDSLPCCRVIDIGKLLDELLDSANDDILFALYALGIEYRGKDTDFPNFSGLWDTYITILRHLDTASIIEFNEDLATVTITKRGKCRCEDPETQPTQENPGNQVEVARHA